MARVIEAFVYATPTIMSVGIWWIAASAMMATGVNHQPAHVVGIGVGVIAFAIINPIHRRACRDEPVDHVDP